MKLKKAFSIISASALMLTCMPLPASAIYTYYAEDEEIKNEYENEKQYRMPDYPRAVIATFGIDPDYGLADNCFTEDGAFTYYGYNYNINHKDGYIMVSDQSNGMSTSFSANWYDCEESSFAVDSVYYNPENVGLDSPVLKADLYYTNKGAVSSVKAGPLLRFNDDKIKLFVVEKTILSDDYSNYEKIGEYESKGKTYVLYKKSEDKNGNAFYYAVNTSDIIDEEAFEKINMEEFWSTSASTALADHVENVSELTGSGKLRLDNCGYMVENHGGIGNFFVDARILNSFAIPEEEELRTSENGDPVVYDSNILKNIGGYIYRLDSGGDESYIIPEGVGKYTAKIADDASGYVSSGYRFETLPDTSDHNYRLDYEYKIDGNCNGIVTLWMNDPNVQIDFIDDKDGSLSSQLVNNSQYMGTIMLLGEEYNLYREAIVFPEFAPVRTDMSNDGAYNSYKIVHTVQPDENGVIKSSLPVYALVELAKKFGVKTGKLCGIDLGTCVYYGERSIQVLKNELSEDEKSVLDQEDSYVLGSKLTSSTKGTTLDDYQYWFTYWPVSTCIAHQNGLASVIHERAGYTDLSIDGYTELSIGKTLDSDKYVEKNVTYGITKNYIADYKIKYTADDEYSSSIGYSLEGNNQSANYLPDNEYRYIDLKIIEKPSFDTVEEQMKKEESNNIDASVTLKSSELITTFTSCGHEYDLYKADYYMYGGWSRYPFCIYYSFRKDIQDDTDIYDGLVKFADHIEQIVDSGNPFFKEYIATLDVDIRSKTSVCMDVLKNDFTLDPDYVPEIKTPVGDANNDKRINSLDVSLARTYLVKKTADSNAELPETLDVNKNGAFEISDVVLLQSFVMGKIKKFPVDNT